MIATSKSKNIEKQKIKMLITDVDGVLTDGGMYYSEKGEIVKKFNTTDGMGIEILVKNGIVPVILTKEDSDIVLKRAEKLKIKETYTGVEDKLKKGEEIIKKHNFSFDEVVYVGDDINDITLLKKVGFSCCPFDAVEEVKKVANYVCKAKGGEGIVREVTDFILARKFAVVPHSEIMTQSPKIVDKPWGREIWIAEDGEYAGKILEINENMQTSLHYHAKKKETLYVFEGTLNVELLDGTIVVVDTGESITFDPGNAHQLKAIKNVKIFEVSTPQLDDVCRLRDNYNRI